MSAVTRTCPLHDPGDVLQGDVQGLRGFRKGDAQRLQIQLAQDRANVHIGPRNNMGGYQITLYMINVPQENADRTQGTAVAMFSSYKVNTHAAVAQIHSDMQQQQQWFERQQADYHAREQAQDRQLAAYQRRQDAQDRQFAAFDNGLLNNTVVFDRELNGHGTVSNDLADALVQADPNRFREVGASDYVKGIDY